MSKSSLDDSLAELATACRVLALNGHADKALGRLQPSVMSSFWAWYKRQLERYEKLHGGLAVV